MDQNWKRKSSTCCRVCGTKEQESVGREGVLGMFKLPVKTSYFTEKDSHECERMAAETPERETRLQHVRINVKGSQLKPLRRKTDYSR